MSQQLIHVDYENKQIQVRDDRFRHMCLELSDNKTDCVLIGFGNYEYFIFRFSLLDRHFFECDLGILVLECKDPYHITLTPLYRNFNWSTK